MNKEDFSIEYDSIEDYIKTRTIVEEGGSGGGGGGTFNHSELEQLDYETSGHTGFASSLDIEEVRGDIVDSEDRVVNVLGTPAEGTVSADVEALKVQVTGLNAKVQAVLDRFVPQPDAPDPEVPSYIPEYYVLATDEDFSGTANGSFKYIGTEEYVIVPYRIKGVVVRSYNLMFQSKAVRGVASYSNLVLDYTSMFNDAGVTGAILELDYLDTSGAYKFTYMFKGCKAGTLDLSNFNTSNVYSVQEIFSSCKATTIDVTGWDTSKVTYFTYCFKQSSVKTLIGLGDWTNENGGNYEDMFYDCRPLILDLSGFTTPLIGTYSRMLSDAYVTEALAKTQSDADWFNSASLGKPASYTFTVKEVV